MSGLRARLAGYLISPVLADEQERQRDDIAELRAAVGRAEERQRATIDELRSAVDDLSARIGALAAAVEAEAEVAENR